MKNLILVRSRRRLIAEANGGQTEVYGRSIRIVLVEPSGMGLMAKGRRKKISEEAFYDLRNELLWTACPLYGRCLDYLIEMSSFTGKDRWKNRFLCFVCPFLENYKRFKQRPDDEEIIPVIKKELPKIKETVDSTKGYAFVSDEAIDYIFAPSASGGYRVYERRNGEEAGSGYYESPPLFSEEEVFKNPSDLAELAQEIYLPIGHAMQNFFQPDHFSKHADNLFDELLPGKENKPEKKQGWTRIVYGRQARDLPVKAQKPASALRSSGQANFRGGKYVVEIDGRPFPIDAACEKTALRKVRCWNKATINTTIRLFAITRNRRREVKV